MENIYLKAGTNIALKDDSNYDWAITRETDAFSTKINGYVFTGGWDTTPSRTILEDGYYGFTVKKASDDAFDLENEAYDDLLDYFLIRDLVSP